MLFAMLRHLGSFVYTAWEMLRSALGTSDLSIIVFSIGVPLVIFAAGVGGNWYGHRPRTWGTLAAEFENWIKPARLAIGVTAVAWAVLWSWAVCKALYNDHQDLSGRLRSVVNEKNALKTSLADRDIAITKLREERKNQTAKVGNPSQVPVFRHEPSLRDRANRLANELQAFNDERDKHLPSFYADSGMTFEQQLAASAPQRAYQQQTFKLYEGRFAVQVVTIVQEFKAKGIDVSPIENCAASGICSPTPIPVELHALAARLDDNGNVRRQN